MNKNKIILNPQINFSKKSIERFVNSNPSSKEKMRNHIAVNNKEKLLQRQLSKKDNHFFDTGADISSYNYSLDLLKYKNLLRSQINIFNINDDDVSKLISYYDGNYCLYKSIDNKQYNNKSLNILFDDCEKFLKIVDDLPILKREEYKEKLKNVFNNILSIAKNKEAVSTVLNEILLSDRAYNYFVNIAKSLDEKDIPNSIRFKHIDCHKTLTEEDKKYIFENGEDYTRRNLLNIFTTDKEITELLKLHPEIFINNDIDMTLERQMIIADKLPTFISYIEDLKPDVKKYVIENKCLEFIKGFETFAPFYNFYTDVYYNRSSYEPTLQWGDSERKKYKKYLSPVYTDYSQDFYKELLHSILVHKYDFSDDIINKNISKIIFYLKDYNDEIYTIIHKLRQHVKENLIEDLDKYADSACFYIEPEVSYLFFEPVFLRILQNAPENMLVNFINEDPSFFNLIKNPSDNLKRTILKINGHYIKYIKNPSEDLLQIAKEHGATDEELYYVEHPEMINIDCIKNDPWLLIIATNITDDMLRLALEKNYYIMLRIDNIYEYEHIAKYVIEDKPYLLTFVNNPSLNIKDVHFSSKDVFCLFFIDNPTDDDKEKASLFYRSSELFEDDISYFNLSENAKFNTLSYIFSDRFIHNHEECYGRISFIRNETYDFQKKAIERYPGAIAFIKNPSTELCEIAISKDPNYICEIKNQTEHLINLALTKTNEYLWLHCIQNPSQEQIINYINQKNKRYDEIKNNTISNYNNYFYIESEKVFCLDEDHQMKLVKLNPLNVFNIGNVTEKVYNYAIDNIPENKYNTLLFICDCLTRTEYENSKLPYNAYITDKFMKKIINTILDNMSKQKNISYSNIYDIPQELLMLLTNIDQSYLDKDIQNKLLNLYMTNKSLGIARLFYYIYNIDSDVKEKLLKDDIENICLLVNPTEEDIKYVMNHCESKDKLLSILKSIFIDWNTVSTKLWKTVRKLYSNITIGEQQNKYISLNIN